MDTKSGKAVRHLQDELEERLSALESNPIEEELRVEGDLPTFLKIALKKEVAASNIASYWIPRVEEGSDE